MDLVLKDMIKRCRELDLRVARTEADLKAEAAVMLTMQTMNFVYSTEHKVALRSRRHYEKRPVPRRTGSWY